MKKKDLIISIILWVVIWQALSLLINNSIFLVSPYTVIKELILLIPTKSFWISIISSIYKIVIGFLLGVGCGIIFATASFRYEIINKLLEPLILLSKTIPVASFIILALVWLSSSKIDILIAFLMVMPIVYTNVVQGLQSVDKEMLEVVKVYNVSVQKAIRAIYIPAVYPYFHASIKIGLGLAWKAGVAAEVIGMANNSIGGNLQQAKLYLDTPALFAWTTVIVIISILLEKIFLYIFSKIGELVTRI